MRNPHTVAELKEYISEAFIEIDADQDLCRAMCHNVLERFEECCNVEGHFEHLKRLKKCKQSVKQMYINSNEQI